MPKVLGNRGFALKTHSMFSIHTIFTPDQSRNATSPVILDSHLGKARSWKSHGNRNLVVFEKLRSQNAICVHKNAKPVVRSSRLNFIFEKFRFGDGLVWTVGLTGKIKLRFQILPG